MGRYDTADRHTRSNSRGGEESITARQILDRFTSVDDLLRETNSTLEQTVAVNEALAANIGSLAEALGEDVDLSDFAAAELPIVSDAIVEPGEQVTDEIVVPEDSVLTDVRLSFPQGSAQSVGIGVVGRDGESLVPFGGGQFIALDNTVETFELNYDVQKDETITVRYVNNREADDPNDPAEIQELTAFPSAVVTFTRRQI